jgi:hypothetical protein
VLFAQAPDIKPESSNAVTQGLRRSQHVRGRCILHIPTPDYSKISPKIDARRRNPRIGDNDKKVSGPLTCSMIQMLATNLLGIGWKI